jgi:hypothetical protein
MKSINIMCGNNAGLLIVKAAGHIVTCGLSRVKRVSQHKNFKVQRGDSKNMNQTTARTDSVSPFEIVALKIRALFRNDWDSRGIRVDR